MDRQQGKNGVTSCEKALDELFLDAPQPSPS